MCKSFCFILILLFIIAVPFTGCKKDLNHYTFSKDFLTWVYFKEGSYWIFENKEKSSIDSCHIKYPPVFSTSDDENENGFLFDEIQMIFLSSFLRETYIHAGSEYDYATYSTYGGISSVGSIRTNADIGQKIIWDRNVYETLSWDSTFTLNGIVFRNVIHTRVAYPGFDYDSIIREYYFCKNIGLM